MIIIATWLYRLALATQHRKLVVWYLRLLAQRYGLTATYTLERGWILYPIPQEVK